MSQASAMMAMTSPGRRLCRDPPAKTVRARRNGFGRDLTRTRPAGSLVESDQLTSGHNRTMLETEHVGAMLLRIEAH
jgi:hypothetical protein